MFLRLRRLNTTWNFARSITRVSTRALRTLFVYAEFTKKKVFELLTLAVGCSASCRPASREISTSECDVTLRRVKVERYCLPATKQRDISHDVSSFLFQYCLLYEAPFSTSSSIFFFADDKTMNYPYIYMELSFGSIPSLLTPMLRYIRRLKLLGMQDDG